MVMGLGNLCCLEPIRVLVKCTWVNALIVGLSDLMPLKFEGYIINWIGVERPPIHSWTWGIVFKTLNLFFLKK